METIGIITLNDKTYNLGNRLQKYAVNEIVKNMGYTPTNIIHEDNNCNVISKIKILTDDLLFNRGKLIHRSHLFNEFEKKYIKDKNKISDGSILNCKYVLCGSDQIWNPNWAGDSIYFASFVEKSKRIAYAASFGVSSIPDFKKAHYIKYLNEMAAISVREEEGARLVKKLTGRNSEILIDPTMMLDKEQWKKISVKPNYYNGRKYILTYFLGNISQNKREYIDKLSKTYSYELINLEFNNKNDYWYNTGPSEFVWLIENCEFMVTDSFHGSVFSIIMDVPFLVFDREDSHDKMNSRIDNLLNLFQLNDRLFNSNTNENVFVKDYSHVLDILDAEKKKAYNYLKSYLYE